MDESSPVIRHYHEFPVPVSIIMPVCVDTHWQAVHVNGVTLSLTLLLLPQSQLDCLVVSRAIPIPFCSTNHFQYQHEEEGSGDLGSLYVNLWNAIIG